VIDTPIPERHLSKYLETLFLILRSLPETLKLNSTSDSISLHAGANKQLIEKLNDELFCETELTCHNTEWSFIVNVSKA